MQLERAQPQDLPIILQFIEESRVQLAALGVNQWQDGYPNEQTIHRDIAQKEGYLLCTPAPCAYAAVSFAGEHTYATLYDGCWQSEQPYAVIHRVATGQACRRQGNATALLQEVFSLCHKNGIHYLRIDTHADNLPMQRLLARLDFSRCGVIHLEDGAPRLAYDKLISK